MSPPPLNENPWTTEQDQTLRELWGSLSASKIGAKVGRTKNAVIGRARRIGLPKVQQNPPRLFEPRPKPAAVEEDECTSFGGDTMCMCSFCRTQRHSDGPEPTDDPMPTVAESREYLSSPLPHHSRRWRPLAECGSSDCRWPLDLSDLKKRATLFCCEQVELGKSYCREHLLRSMSKR